MDSRNCLDLLENVKLSCPAGIRTVALPARTPNIIKFYFVIEVIKVLRDVYFLIQLLSYNF
jgi:hypothetical protein